MAKAKAKAKAKPKGKKKGGGDLSDRFEDGDIDEMRREYEQEKSEREAFSGAGFYEWQSGDNNLRALPLKKGTKKGSNQLCVETLVHFQVGPDTKTFSCPRTKDKKAKCWLCSRSAELMDSQDDKDIQEGKDLRAKKRYLYLVYDRDAVDEGIQICETGVTVFDDLMTYVLQDGWGKIWDLDEGYDFTVTKTGKRRRTKYKTIVEKDSSAIDDDIRELLEEGENELPDLLNLRKYDDDEAMKAAYYGEDDDEEDDEDDDDDDDEEDEEDDDDSDSDDDDDDDDEDDDEPAPKSKAKAKGKKADEDDDDDEDEDDDEDDDDDEEDDEEDDDDDEDDEDDEEDEDEDDDDDDEEDDKPAPKSKRPTGKKVTGKAPPKKKPAAKAKAKPAGRGGAARQKVDAALKKKGTAAKAKPKAKAKGKKKK